MLLSTAMMVNAGIQTATSLYGLQSSKAQSKAQKKVAEARSEFNLKEIERAFNVAYSDVMSRYALSRDTYIKSATNAIGQTNAQISGNAHNVDLTNSSFKGDLNAEMDHNLIQNVNILLKNQSNETRALINQNSNAKIQAGNALTDARIGIDANYEQSKMMAYTQFASGALNLYGSYKQREIDVNRDETKDFFTNYNFGGGL